MKQIILSLLLTANVTLFAQTLVPFESSRWKITADESVIEEHLGKKCLKIRGGSALLSDANFKNGIIEFDIAILKERHFPGIEFRMQDGKNFEEYYVRPHQSGNPDAMQYIPVYNGSASWQLYHGDGFSNAHVLPFDRWLHIKMLVNGKQAEVYFDDEKDPVLFMHTLKREPVAGMISLSNPSPVAVRYANFSYRNVDGIMLKNKPKPAEPLPSSVIKSYEVSDPFDEKMLSDKIILGQSDKSSRTWKELEVDEIGIANFARLSGVEQNKNTVFAKVTIDSEREEIKKLTFGFSDRVKIYLNNKLLYSGEDNFTSRDYRFLGTIGFFDAVYLDLKKGRNEIWIAVSESFGGWGIKAKLEGIP